MAFGTARTCRTMCGTALPILILGGTTSHWACRDRKALPSKSTLLYTPLYSNREYGKWNELLKNVKYSFWCQGWGGMVGMNPEMRYVYGWKWFQGREETLKSEIYYAGYSLPEEGVEDTLLELLNTRLDKTLEDIERIYSHRFLRLERAIVIT